MNNQNNHLTTTYSHTHSCHWEDGHFIGEFKVLGESGPLLYRIAFWDCFGDAGPLSVG